MECSGLNGQPPLSQDYREKKGSEWREGREETDEKYMCNVKEILDY